jgi:BlaI family penicillinase repressor
MKKFPKISEAEFQVMKVLWKRSPMTASEIIEELKKDTDWSPKTIHTLINRLVEKKAVEVKKLTPYQYSPLIEEDAYKGEEVHSFLKKMYDGSLNMLVASFIRDEKLSREEIEDLKKILGE